ncbi:MAG: glycosyltransferase [Planctomycetes bacterium]|nr:glycosyltransferase [Planctomycetota bacterium]
MNKIALFIAHYTLGNSPSIINFIELLSDYYSVHLFLKCVTLKHINVLKKANVKIVDLDSSRSPLNYFLERLKKEPLSYKHYISFDPHGFVLCKLLFPDSRPFYYSLELYLKNDHFGLYYPKEIMEKERAEIHSISGLIIQSQEKESLFRNDYNLQSSIPSFLLPITYKGPSNRQKNNTYLRNKYAIGIDRKIALHLGGIAAWFSCIELAMTFSHIQNWILFFHGYGDKKYLPDLQQALRKHNINNVIISDDTFENIEDVDKIVMSCDLGLAWYNDISTGFRTAGKSSGKIPSYMKFGLPVIAKKYPSTIQAIENTGSGLCVDNFNEIPNAISKIEDNYTIYSQNACAEYDKTYRFENYVRQILDFIECARMSQATSTKDFDANTGSYRKEPDTKIYADKSTRHFNWDKLLENKRVEDFLVTDELWGENQGAENIGRVLWRKYLKDAISCKNIRVLEIGFGSGIDYRALENEGVFDKGRVKYYGADVTYKFAKHASMHFKNMKPVLMDGYHLPFKDRSFDIVYLRHVLEHQSHYEELLSEVFRVCGTDVFINFFIELSDSDIDKINYDGTWYHNTYSKKKFDLFVKRYGFGIHKTETHRKEEKVDSIVILKRNDVQCIKLETTNEKNNVVCDYGGVTDSATQKITKTNQNNRKYPEADKWALSDFIVNKIIPIVGVRPYPLDELLMMCSVVSYFEPDIIIEWGTHAGKSARVFYEISNHLGIKTDIYSIDSPADANHIENLKDQGERARYIKGLPVNRYLGDGITVAKEILSSNSHRFPLFFVDGDYSYDAVWRDLSEIKKSVNAAAILLHDSFLQDDQSKYNCEPNFAIKQFSEENNLDVWHTAMGLPGMSLVWLRPHASDKNLTKSTEVFRRKKPFPILHTVEFYYPHTGGAEFVVQQLSERLVKRGYDVTVATSRLENRKAMEHNGVKIEEFSVKGSIGNGIYGSDVELYKHFLLTHPAGVVLNYAAQQWATDLAFSVIGATASRRVNVIAPCGYSALADSRTLRWPQFAAYFSNILPKVLPLYAAAVYHSSIYKDYEFAQRCGLNNSVIIPNGVSEEEFSIKPKIHFREKYHIATKYFGLCVANYYEGKGQERVIECVKQMNRQDFTMVFVGKEGDQLSYLKAMSVDLNVKYLADIPREDTLAAFHEADIFLFGSYIEASPLVIIEAKASKTPFVSTDCGNVREWKGGVVCAPNEMAIHANRILNDEGLRKRLADEGWKEWKDKLTWESVVDKYEELYVRLFSEKQKSASECSQAHYLQGALDSNGLPGSDSIIMTATELPELLKKAEDMFLRGEYNEAIDKYKTIIEIDPALSDAYTGLAIAYTKINRIDNAISTLEKSICLCASEASIYNNLGVLYFKKDMPLDAKTYFEIALLLNPDYKEARQNLEKVDAVLSETSKTRKTNHIVGLIFSKDRAMQLDATLRSFYLHCGDADTLDLKVVYKTSNAVYEKQYEDLKKDYTDVMFIKEVDFKEQVLSTVRKYAYVLFMVDDNVFVRKFYISNLTNSLSENKNAIGFSLRLGENTVYCYALHSSQNPPKFINVTNDIRKYDWTTAELDFGYPLEVSSSLYRVKELYPLLVQVNFKNPNTLEDQLATNKHIYAKTRPIILCSKLSLTFCAPLNMVQDVCDNRAGNENCYSSEMLANKFGEGYRIDVEKYTDFIPNACHQEVPLDFINSKQ